MKESISAVVAVIEHNGMVLVGRKRAEPNHVFDGAWHIPGGKVERDETDEQALLREMNEETGLTISVRRFLGTRTDTTSGAIVRWYLCSPVSGEAGAGSDLEELRFVPRTSVRDVCDPKAVALWPNEVAAYLNPPK
jgi:8-oxo-dGTP pyrophosphatase MutT (NUDIX family)